VKEADRIGWFDGKVERVNEVRSDRRFHVDP
jgi:hypothetical protein